MPGKRVVMVTSSPEAGGVDDIRYAKFLPAAYRREPMLLPTATWWQWCGRQVHVARAADPDAAVRLLVVHGAGGYSGLVWPLAASVAREGVDLMAVDLPLYGDTVEPHPESVRYADWIRLLCDFVCAEMETDGRPLVLFGASMGGMLAYEVAARTGTVAHVVATCLLDPSDPAARRAATRWSYTATAGSALLRVVDPLFGRVRVPIRWIADMQSMSLNPALSRICADDPKGGGARVPLGFLASFLDYHHVPPEEFEAAPVTLVHPGADRWTPPELSIRFLRRIPERTRLVLLDRCGHFPIEEPGLGQLQTALRSVLTSAEA